MLHGNALQKISAKVTTYQILGEDAFTMFTNRGSTASFTFTLPPAADIQAGWWCAFAGISAYGFVVASSGSLDNIVTLNDAGADSLTMTTTSLIIGAYIKFIWDGTGWITVRGAGNTMTGA